MNPYYEDDRVTLHHGEALEVLRSIPSDSVDSICTDPPYGLSNTNPGQVADALKSWVSGDHEAVPTARGGGFMGADWDSFVPPPAVWEECFRVLKPGGHALVFAGSRTQDLMGLAIRLAGFEIRDSLAWLHGNGFPKSMDVSKAIDKGSGVNRERQLEFTAWMRTTGLTAAQIDQITGSNMGGHYLTASSQPAIATADLFDRLRPHLPAVPEYIERLVAERTGVEFTDYASREVTGEHEVWENRATYAITSADGLRRDNPASEAARTWQGWGTALKPAIEPIIMARKPLDGTVAANVLAHGTGGLNIDASRVPTNDRWEGSGKESGPGHALNGSADGSLNVSVSSTHEAGRFPTNVVLDQNAAAAMDEQSGRSASKQIAGARSGKESGILGGFAGQSEALMGHTDAGGASRFFHVFKYEPKAPKSERPALTRDDGTVLQHATVKPLALMDWCIKLVTPPAGLVLEPFAGSGTTLQSAKDHGFRAIGVEQDRDHCDLIVQRLTGARAERPPRPTPAQIHGQLGLDFEVA